MERSAAIELRGQDGRIKSAGHRARAERVAAGARARWEVSATEWERLSIADDFLSAIARRAEQAGVDPREALRRAVRVMWAAGEGLVGQIVDQEDSRG